jgi:hypothetical protein
MVLRRSASLARDNMKTPFAGDLPEEQRMPIPVDRRSVHSLTDRTPLVQGRWMAVRGRVHPLFGASQVCEIVGMPAPEGLDISSPS